MMKLLFISRKCKKNVACEETPKLMEIYNCLIQLPSCRWCQNESKSVRPAMYTQKIVLGEPYESSSRERILTYEIIQSLHYNFGNYSLISVLAKTVRHWLICVQLLWWLEIYLDCRFLSENSSRTKHFTIGQ